MPKENDYVDIDGMNLEENPYADYNRLAKLYDTAWNTADELGPLGRIAFDTAASYGLNKAAKPLVVASVPPLVAASTLAKIQNAGNRFVGELPATLAKAVARGVETYHNSGDLGDVATRMLLSGVSGGGKAIQNEFYRLPKEMYDKRHIVKSLGKEVMRPSSAYAETGGEY